MSNDLEATFRAAAVQDASVWLDRARSTEKACALIEQAGAGGADIVALPESFIPGFPYWVFVKPLGETTSWHEQLHHQSVEVPGPEVDALVAAARRAGVIAVVGVTESEPGSMGTLYNTNVVVGPDGLLGKHRKLVATWGERVVWAGSPRRLALAPPRRLEVAPPAVGFSVLRVIADRAPRCRSGAEP
ncbi:Carbon-nitrogen hydrolase [Gaiella occulta]|uniref:Carbon-nitrogen hydrolase n=1 Tax=Gaiella occulta TaxID=1002870 RepID=A0A7M2YUB5_9ACTN|nr:nitrilase-related carbon-nitrogen hydrolase [Gaiella occulta]RDI73209.1 Carbon-nitrogen hydrolase [Gaiella occulta]